ncbi:MAG: translation initiation factor IF-2 [Proteobacteria bacterium]|nr:translation initiation factor IF-2 [Pseudomonadota bacterium]
MTRVYEIAKEVGIPNKDLIAKIRALGLEVNNHMSSLDADDVARIKRSLEKEKSVVAAPPPQKLSTGTVLRRRSSGDKETPDDKPVATAPPGVTTRPSSSPTARDNGHPERAPAPVVRRRAADDDVVEPPTRKSEPVIARPVEPPTRKSEPVIARPAPIVEKPAPVVEAKPEPVVEVKPEPTRAPPVEAVVAKPVVTAPVVTAPVVAAPVVTAPVVTPPVAAPVVAAPVATAPVVEAPKPKPPIVATPAPKPPVAPTAPTTPERPRSRVIVAGPQIVSTRANDGIGGTRTVVEVEPPPSTPLPARVIESRESHQSRNAHSSSRTPSNPIVEYQHRPRTVQEVGQAARSQFEIELERARARTAARPETIAPPISISTEPASAESTGEVVAPPTRDPSRPAVGSVISLPPRIKITERTPVTGRAAPAGAPQPANQLRDRFKHQQQQRPRPGGPGGRPGMHDFGRKKLPLGKKGKQTTLTTPAEHKRVIRIEDTIAIGDLAKGMGVKSPEVLKKLWGMGMTGVNINASIDFETAQILSSEFGYEVQNVAFKEEDAFNEKVDDDANLVHRSPVVTIMGHVDHGKTSLLDTIRKTRVAAGESGGITQHVAAYKVPVPGHGDIVFLDTPGHEAFTEMRARGAQATDIVVLVVAANDGVMPQTIEALSHAKDAGVQIIVAVNKCDMPDAQPERVRQQLADHGLIAEEWGGETIYANVSALKNEGIDKLLESIAVSAEMLNLRANPDKPGSGVVIEARLDRNRGPISTVLVQEGTLRVGDVIIAGRVFGKVRAMLDDRGNSIKEAGPSTPVEILGIDGVPDAGDQVNIADDEKVAKEVVENRRAIYRKRVLASTVKVSLESLMERAMETGAKEFKIVLKADVQGSAEALKAALTKLSTEKVKVIVIAAGVGGITESDVQLAKAGHAIVLGFHVRPAGKSNKLAEQEGVEIRLYDIIYDALDEVRTAMAGLLAPIKREIPMGKLSVRETFTIPKIGTIAGCLVTDGKVNRKAHLRVIRDNVQIYEGKVGSLRRFKDDVSEVGNNFECGVMIAGYNELKVGDVIEAFEVIEEAAKL